MILNSYARYLFQRNARLIQIPDSRSSLTTTLLNKLPFALCISCKLAAESCGILLEGESKCEELSLRAPIVRFFGSVCVDCFVPERGVHYDYHLMDASHHN